MVLLKLLLLMLCIVLLFNNVNESAFVRLYYLLSENAYVCRMYIRCIGLGNVMIYLLQACKDNKHYPDPRGQINLVIIQLHHMIDVLCRMSITQYR